MNRLVLLLVLLAACDERTVTVNSHGTSVRVETHRRINGGDCAIVVETTGGSIVPVLVPMPLPYPTLAETVSPAQ